MNENFAVVAKYLIYAYDKTPWLRMKENSIWEVALYLMIGMCVNLQCNQQKQ